MKENHIYPSKEASGNQKQPL